MDNFALGHSDGHFQKETANFRGDVYREVVRGLPGTPILREGLVIFLPGACTNWHHHTGDQILFISEGIGFVQRDSQPPQQVRKGDRIFIPAGIKHRHGAFEDTLCMHSAMTTGETKWFNDEDNPLVIRPTNSPWSVQGEPPRH